MRLDVPAHLSRLCLALFGEGVIAAPAGNLTELHKHIIQEKAQPDAFAFPLCAHHVHAVVPVAGAHERQSVLAIIETSQDGSYTVFIQTGRLLRPAGQIIIGVLVRVYRAALDKVDRLIPYTVIPGRSGVAAGGAR